MRQAAGRHFADVVIGVSPDAGVGQGHAAADAVEAACRARCRRATSSSTSSRVEGEAALRERVHAAALTVPRVREMHNLRVVAVEGGLQVALHLKLPGELTLEAAHSVASQVERAIAEAVPEVISVQTHLEPLREPGTGTGAGGGRRRGRRSDGSADRRGPTGSPPRELRFLQTDDGLVAS